jgi:hypothetical protein
MLDLRWIVYTLFWVSTIPGEVHAAASVVRGKLRLFPDPVTLAVEVV